MSAPPALSPARKLTLLPLIAATYFIVSGGPFGLEDTVAKAGYGGAILILLLTPALWSFPTALMVSELSSALPEDGGYYIWVKRGMGSFWGFQEAWLSLVGSVFDMAIYPTLFVSYLGHFLPATTAGQRATWIGVGLIAAAAAWNMLGAKTVGGSSVVMGVLLLSPFALLAAASVFHGGMFAARPPLPRHADILGGVLVAMWNYMGWDNTSTVAGEVENPQRTYPRAMAGAVALVALGYVLPIAAVALTGLDAGRWETGGWADVARAVLGTGVAGALVALGITVGGMLGAAGSLNALTMALSRVPAALAEDGFLPKIFARRDPKTDAPRWAIAGCAAAWALGLMLPFSKLLMLDMLLTGSSILLEFAALVALRIREPQLARPYRVPGGMAGAIAVCIPPAVLMLLTVLRNQVEPVGPINALQFGGILMALGVVAYFVGVRNRRP
ncbi:MAG: APC family permease [Bryobacteraceae bacterium]|jgi:amino acid transporter